MRHGKSVVFTVAGAPLRIVDTPVPDPGPGEMLVRLSMAGICGSDIHRLAGDTSSSGEPVCFGHEGVGRVEALGKDVTTDRAGEPLRVGDRVYWFPGNVCGVCRPCREQQSIAFCENFRWPLPAHQPNAATFQELATLGPSVPAFKVPQGTLDEALIAFGCAMPTAIGGLARLGGISDDVIIQGAGPLGLAAAVLAARQGARRIIVIGDPDDRLAIARRLGASETLSLKSTSLSERRARISELTDGRGAGTVIEAAGQIDAFAEGLDLVATHGRYLVLGLYSGSATTAINPVTINNRNLTIIGSLGYPLQALAQTVRLAGEIGAQSGFADLITRRFPIDQAEAAIAAAGSGELVKAVLVPGARS